MSAPVALVVTPSTFLLRGSTCPTCSHLLKLSICGHDNASDFKLMLRCAGCNKYRPVVITYVETSGMSFLPADLIRFPHQLRVPQEPPLVAPQAPLPPSQDDAPTAPTAPQCDDDNKDQDDTSESSDSDNSDATEEHMFNQPVNRDVHVRCRECTEIYNNPSDAQPIPDPVSPVMLRCCDCGVRVPDKDIYPPSQTDSDEEKDVPATQSPEVAPSNKRNLPVRRRLEMSPVHRPQTTLPFAFPSKKDEPAANPAADPDSDVEIVDRPRKLPNLRHYRRVLDSL